jgi:CysZ protein
MPKSFSEKLYLKKVPGMGRILCWLKERCVGRTLRLLAAINVENAMFIKGLKYFLAGFVLILKPSIRVRVIIPLLINVVLLFSIYYIYYYLWLYFSIEFLFTYLTETFSYLEKLFDNNFFKLIIWAFIYPLFIFLAAVVFLFTFLFVVPLFIGTLIVWPFNSLLAKTVEEYLTGEKLQIASEPLLTTFFNFIKWKLTRLWYYLKWYIMLMIISVPIFWFPLVNMIPLMLWFLFIAWSVTLEYSEYTFSNHNYNFFEQRKLLVKKRILSLGFGSGIIIIMFIPLVNFLIMPVAVAGATYMWVEEFAYLAD